MAANLGDYLTFVFDVDLTRLTAGLNKAKEQVIGATTAVNSFGQGLSQTGKGQISTWSKVDAEMTKIRDNLGGMLSMANQMSLTAMRTVLAGGAALMIAAFPTKEAIEFEKQMSMVAGVTRATADDMKKLTAAAMQMGRSTIYSATQAAEAMTLLAKAGFNTSEIITMLPSTMQLAAAGGISIAQAADVASAAIRGFNLSATDMTHVSDVIATSANLSAVSVEDIAESLRYVAPAAAAAGMGINEVGAALAVLGNAGIKGSMGGTTLRQILLRLTDESKTFSDALNRLGVQVFDVTGKMKPFTEIMAGLAKANVSITQIGQIFTARSASGVAALTNNIGQLQQFTLENQSAAGEAKRLADVMLNNVAGSIEYLKSSLASLSIAVAGPLLGGLKMLIDVLAEVFNAMQKAASFPLFGALNTALGYILSTLTSILSVLGGIAGVIVSPVLTPIITLAAAMGGLLLVMGGAGIIISGFLRTMVFLADKTKYLSGVFLAAKVEMSAFAMAATPVGKILSSIWGALKVGAGDLLTILTLMTGWQVAMVAAIGVVIASLIVWWGWQDRVAKKSKEAADKASANRKTFDEMSSPLNRTAPGTAEHGKVIDELLKKYPELEGVLRKTNQSWTEQEQILNQFRTTLVVKELNTAMASMDLVINKMDELIAKKKKWDVEDKAIPAMPKPESGSYWKERGEAQAKLSPGTLFASEATLNKAKAQHNKAGDDIVDKTRIQSAQVRQRWQTMLDSINWKAIGKDPLSMTKSSKSDFLEVFKSSEESVRRVNDQITAGGWSLDKWVDALINATAEMREQNALLESRKAKVSTDESIIAATQQAEKLIGLFNMLPETMRNAKSSTGQSAQEAIAGTFTKDTKGLGLITGEIPGIIKNMVNQMAMFGPEATKLMEDDVVKIIKKFEGLPPGFKVTADVLIAEFKNIGANWDKYVVQVMSKPLTVDLPSFGGLNPLEPSYQQIPRLEGNVELKDWLNKNAAGAKYLNQELAAAFLTFKTGSADIKKADKFDFSSWSRGAQERANAIASVLRQETDLSRDAIAGIIGNIYQETGGTFKPTAEEKPGTGKGGFGIAQWTGERRKAIEKALGESKYDLVAQAKYLAETLKTDYKSTYDILLKADITAAESTKVFEAGYEKAGVKAMGTRTGAAMGWNDQATRMTDNLGKLNSQLARFAGESDQVRKGIAAALIDLPDEIPHYKPFKQIVEEAKKEGKEWANTIEASVSDVLRTQEKLGKEGGSAVFGRIESKEIVSKAQNVYQMIENIRQRGGMATTDALAKQALEKGLEVEGKIKDAKYALQQVEVSTGPNKESQIDDAKANLRKVEATGALELAQFQLTTAKEISQLNIYKIQERQQAVQNELAATESITALKQAEASTEKELLQTRLAMGTITGTAFVGESIKVENQLYQDQLALLDKRLATAQEMERLAIAEANAKAGSQPIEATQAQKTKATLDLVKETLDIINKKKEAITRNVTEMEKFVQAAQKARQELAGIGVDLLTKFAWGPMQERFASLVKNAKEFGDLSRRINDMQLIPKDLKPGETFKADPSFVTTIQAMANAATALGSPWAQPLVDAVKELTGPITAERANQIKEQIQFQIIPQLKAEGDFQIKYKETIDAGASAIKDGINSMVDAMVDGGKDLKKAANTMFKNLFKASLTDGLKELEQLLINGFKKLFEAAGSSVGGAVGSAIMGVIGIVGMILTSGKSSSSFSPSGVESNVTTHEAVRGVIAGETSIPIAEVSVSLSEAVSPHLIELRKIEANTRGGGAGGGGGSNVNITVDIPDLQAALQEFFAQYFSKELMAGA